MKKLFVLGLIFLGYYVHGRVVFSPAHVNQWLAEHNARLMSGESTACDDFIDDADLTITLPRGGAGAQEVPGDKGTLCEYFKRASAAFILLRANVTTTMEDVEVKRDGFPWREAEVAYAQVSSVSVAGLPAKTFKSNDTMVLQRTFSGLKIKAYTSVPVGHGKAEASSEDESGD